MPEPQNNKHEANRAWWQSNSLKSFSDNKYVSPRDSQSVANLRCCCLLCFSHLNLTAADASWQLTASARRQPCPSLGWQAQLRRPPKLALRLFGNNRKKKKNQITATAWIITTHPFTLCTPSTQFNRAIGSQIAFLLPTEAPVLFAASQGKPITSLK